MPANFKPSGLGLAPCQDNIIECAPSIDEPIMVFPEPMQTGCDGSNPIIIKVLENLLNIYAMRQAITIADQIAAMWFDNIRMINNREL